MYIPYFELFVHTYNNIFRNKVFLGSKMIRQHLNEPTNKWFMLPHGFGNSFKKLYQSSNEICNSIEIKLDSNTISFEVCIKTPTSKRSLFSFTNSMDHLRGITPDSPLIEDINFGDNNEKYNKVLFSDEIAINIRKESAKFYGYFGLMPTNLSDEEYFQYSTVYELPSKELFVDMQNLLKLEHNYTIKAIALNVNEDEIKTIYWALNEISQLMVEFNNEYPT